MTKQPLDIQELLALRQKDLENRNKPRFLTQSEREGQRAAIALEQRAQTAERRHAISKTSHVIENPCAAEIHSSGSTSRHIVASPSEKKRKRVNDVRKFTFDWDCSDDTTDTGVLGASKRRYPVLPRNLHDRNSTRTESDSMSTQYDRASSSLHKPDGRSSKEESRAANERHWSDKPLRDMKERDWRIFKEDHSIQVKGGLAPNPIRSWDEAEFPATIMDVIASVGYLEPTPIQKAAIPIALQGNDLIGIAETGSGKTASFVLPMLVHISMLPALNEINRNDGPYAVVLAPTRELAQQIEIETRKFAAALDMVVVSIVGGRSIEEQSFNLRDGAQIVIATPGRLLDCLERHVLVLSQCAYLVMDEADRMVDLGFEEAVNQILDALPLHTMEPDSTEEGDSGITLRPTNSIKYRQTIMFSATMPVAVEKLARKYLRRPATVVIGNAGQAVDTVDQRVEFINGEEKRKRRMAEILNDGTFDRPVIVFVNTKRSCDLLSKYLSSIGWNAATLHGGKTQDQREASLRNLRSGEADVLVATDLAGRGIDVANVSLVLNFNMSKTIEDYVHRIGRTGRAGKQGVAITFLGDDDEELGKAVQAMIRGKPNIRARG